MRLAVHGDEPLTAEFTGRDVFRVSQLNDYKFTFTVLPATIRPRDNMTTTDWVDIREAIMRREIEVTEHNGQGPEDCIMRLNKLYEEDYRHGAVLRWAIQAATPTQLVLVLQSLPASLSHIKAKAQFKMDDCPAVTLATFDLTCSFFRGQRIKGPAPILFSTQPKDTEEALTKDTSQLLEGKNKNKKSNTFTLYKTAKTTSETCIARDKEGEGIGRIGHTR